MGVGDQVPPAIEQLGAKVELIDPDDLAWGNLSRFDAIVTGVRAYERRDDLRCEQQPTARVRLQRRHGDRAVQQVRVQRRAVRPVPGQGQLRTASPTNSRRRRFSTRTIRSSRRRTRSARRRGRTGCRSAACTSSARRTRAITIWCSSRTTSRTTEVRKTGRSSRPATGRGAGSTSASDLWRQLPAGTDGAYQLLANLISLGRAPRPAASIEVTYGSCADATRVRAPDTRAVRRPRSGRRRRSAADLHAVLRSLRSMVCGAASRSASTPATGSPTSRRTRTRNSNRSTPSRRSAPCWCRSTIG